MPAQVSIAVVLLWLASFLLAGCGESSSEKVLTLAHGLDEGHTVHRAMVLMGERLEEYSDGTMRIAIYSGGQLGSERETLELVHATLQGRRQLAETLRKRFVHNGEKRLAIRGIATSLLREADPEPEHQGRETGQEALHESSRSIRSG